MSSVQPRPHRAASRTAEPRREPETIRNPADILTESTNLDEVLAAILGADFEPTTTPSPRSTAVHPAMQSRAVPQGTPRAPQETDDTRAPGSLEATREPRVTVPPRQSEQSARPDGPDGAEAGDRRLPTIIIGALVAGGLVVYAATQWVGTPYPQPQVVVAASTPVVAPAASSAAGEASSSVPAVESPAVPATVSAAAAPPAPAPIPFAAPQPSSTLLPRAGARTSAPAPASLGSAVLPPTAPSTPSTSTSAPEEPEASPDRPEARGEIEIAPAIPPVSLPTTVVADVPAQPGPPDGSDPAETSTSAIPPASSLPPVPQAVPLVREARLLSSVDAYYPDAARRAQVNGVVDVAIVIDVHGRVERARAVEGHPMLRMAAEDAVRRWRFEPATADGVPTVSHKRVRISFK